MVKSLDDIEIVLNPDQKSWMDIVDWCSRTEGWLFTAGDYQTWLKSFEKFWFFAAIDKESKEAVGSVTLAYDRSASGNEDEDIYYVGFYYVRPEWRSTGLGTLLFEKIMEIGKGHNMALHAVMRMSPRYAAKYGFDKMPPYKHDFVSIPIEHLSVPQCWSDPQYTLKDLSEVDEAKVVAFDVGICHRKRDVYLRNFISSKDSFTKVALNSSGDMVGIGCVRVVYSNELCAGPLYADNEAVAKSLLAGILSSIPDIRQYKSFGSLYPAINTEAASIFNEMGGGYAKSEPFTQCQFTKKVFPTDDVRVYAMLECACSAT
ncbi:hypothetical protein Q1695_003995 [Nippostrongylus brasiliensis]|nr:hypothetical protein Q1695_003995 [Nippostrongylus brasiliensis]